MMTIEQTTRTRLAWGLPLLRVGLVAAASALTWLLVVLVDPGVVFPPPSMLSAVAMLPVNVVSLVLVVRLVRSEGERVREVLGFERRRIGRDLLWGLLWLAVLYLPFTGAIMLVVWLQHGDRMFDAMETVFFDPAAMPTLNPIAWGVIGVVAALTFAPLNAPAEELVYRGWSQRVLARRWPIALAIVVPAAVFALQHVWYAPTPDAVLAFLAAFFVWGLGSGIIYLRQRRLMPILFAHGFVNLFFSLPALAMPFLPAELLP
ncbi:CPBP family intramembrane glutamic endopeptidase [Microbacterium soli]|uniref:CAAX prenyl protease 2/Lysostaphin resistance protein A-like domain-containing protein n=1 Tax=Microbacterium soli TaxID=446075 RepID=A0ABP7NCB6_9MICO